jgi:hypothetical protein
MASHHPWDIVDDNGQIYHDVDPYENNKWVIKTLAKWFKWMKQNGVYDNTKIILVSDHGIHWWWFKGQIDKTIPLIENKNLKLNTGIDMVKSMFPLLLVKDFNKNAKLKQDWRFMSNVDSYYMAFSDSAIINQFPLKGRKLESTMIYWIPKIGYKKYLRPIYKIKATNAFDMNSWEKIK